MNRSPFIKPKFNSLQVVMLDVILALLPLVVAGCMAYGMIVAGQLLVAVASALATELLFSALFFKRYTTVLDGSAVVTALLLVFTLSPLTPWHMVAFGASMAILFGKLLWGGVGKNRFNPALVGREFMSVFFASTMASPLLWKTNDLVVTTQDAVLPAAATGYLPEYLNALVFKTTGAMGEYSVVAIALGGLYLLWCNRISWHIPFSLLAAFTLLLWLSGGGPSGFSLAGVLLGTLFMATDMPSSPTTANGKLYYGMMTGAALFIFIKGGVRFEYMSYSILLLNAFAAEASQLFRPSPWGTVKDWKKEAEAAFFLTLKIVGAAFALLSLHYHGLVPYLVYLYVLYIILKFNYSFSNKIDHVI